MWVLHLSTNWENGDSKLTNNSIHQSRSLVAHVSRTVTPLPDMTFPTLSTVEPLCLAHVQRFKVLLQSLLGRWDLDVMDLIGHQAISENLNLDSCGVLSQPTQISKPIFVKKCVFASIALLNYIVRYVGADGSGKEALVERIITAGMQYTVASPYDLAG